MAHREAITYVESPVIRSRQITYETGQVREIDLTGFLETLAIFYDEVAIPFPYGYVRDGVSLWDTNDPQILKFSETLLAEYDAWTNKWKPAIDEGVVRILPPPIQNLNELPPDVLDKVIQSLRYATGEANLMRFVDLPLTIHALRGEKRSPQLKPALEDREALPGLFAQELVTYLVPNVGELNGEQLLELRAHLGSLRQRFTQYIYQHTSEIEQKIREGMEAKEAAKLVAMHTVAPEFFEWDDQRWVKALGRWASYLKTLAPVALGVISGTQGFWTSSLSPVLEGATSIAEHAAEARTNEARAFQCLVRLRRRTGRYHRRAL